MEINEGKSSKYPLLRSNVPIINQNFEKNNEEEIKNQGKDLLSDNNLLGNSKIFYNAFNGGDYEMINHSFDNFTEDNANDDGSQNNKTINDIYLSHTSEIEIEYSFLEDDAVKEIGEMLENKNYESYLQKVDWDESSIIENINKSFDKKDLRQAYNALSNLFDKEDNITPSKDVKMKIESEEKSNKNKEANNLNNEKQKIFEDNINLKENKENNDIHSSIEKISSIIFNNNTNKTNFLSTKSSTLNNTSMNVSLINYKKKKKSKVDFTENFISNVVDLNQTSNNILFCRKRKSLNEKIETKINKTEDISKPVFREFRTYLKKNRSKYKKYFENNKEFWNQFLFGKKTPPFCFKYKEKEYKFKSFKRDFFEFIMSIEDMKTLYENFLKDTEYQLEQKKERKVKNIQAYKYYLNNFHKIYNKEMDENCLIFEFEEKG